MDPSQPLSSRQREPDDSGDAGQSGDTTEITPTATADSESVRALVDEGQDFEAEIVSGVERAGDAEEAGVPSRKRKSTSR
jgi:hypothetical protein